MAVRVKTKRFLPVLQKINGRRYEVRCADLVLGVVLRINNNCWRGFFTIGEDRELVGESPSPTKCKGWIINRYVRYVAAATWKPSPPPEATPATTRREGGVIVVEVELGR